MEEQKQEEKKTEEVVVETTDKIDVIEEARKIRDELKAGMAEKEKLLEREEKLLAKQEAIRALGGGSIVGQPRVKSEEEEKKERAKQFWKGTQIEQAIEKHG